MARTQRDMVLVEEDGEALGGWELPGGFEAGGEEGEDLLRHVEHIANVAGEDHVGIGTDNGVLPTTLDEETKRKLKEWQEQRIKAGIAAPGEAVGVYPLVEDYNSVDRYRRFASDLQKRGWSEARLEKLMGGNFLRVYKDVWGG